MIEHEDVHSASIVIVNRYDRGIADTLSALAGLSSPIPFEVVVVDASAGRLDDIREAFPSIKWYSLPSPVPEKRTIAEQRNLGIQHSDGDIIVFLDASCVPCTNWLANLVSPIRHEQEYIVAGGVTSTRGPSAYDTAAPHESSTPADPCRQYLDEAPTMNMAIHRSVFTTVGTFDEDIGYAEDIDFCWRALDAGYRLRHVPEAEVAHDWGTTREDLKRTYRYGIGRTKLYQKHPDHWRNLLGNDVMVLFYPAYLLGLPLTILFWPYPLLLLVPIVRNIDQRPFRTVGYHIIYGLGVLRGLRKP
jgi:GT2 family glycosyltransferase